MPRQCTIKLALDKIDLNSIRNQIVPREAMPLFPQTQRQVKLSDGGEVYTRELVCRDVRWGNGEESGGVEEAWKFG
jgi:hypothetical protein